MAKTSADIAKEAEELQAKAAALRKEARKMKKLEDAKAAEVQRQRNIQFALDFVEFSKGMFTRDGCKTYYDIIVKNMQEKNAPQPASENSGDIPILPEDHSDGRNFRQF